MRDRDLYAQILGIGVPWRVTEVDLRTKESQVVVKIEHDGSEALRCPTCEKSSPGYDRNVRRWRHLDTCQFRTILECSVPRVQCPEHGVLMMRVPWSEPGSRFTALMEALVIDWLGESSIAGASGMLGLSWDEVDGIMARAVERGLQRRDSVEATKIGVDEKAVAKGQSYLTIVVDQGADGCVLHIADGRKKDALAGYYERIGPEACAKIESVSMDMWTAYIETTTSYVPGAVNKICFDRFHVAQRLGDAVDRVRRQENRDLTAEGDDRLKRSRYFWLKNPENLSADNLARFKELERTSLATAKAWRIKELARHLWQKPPRMVAFLEWTAWYRRALKTKLDPVCRAAETILRHGWGIANAIALGVTNAKSESFNAAIQKIKTRAHGFRNNERFKNAIYFYLGRLDLYPAGVSRD